MERVNVGKGSSWGRVWEKWFRSPPGSLKGADYGRRVWISMTYIPAWRVGDGRSRDCSRGSQRGGVRGGRCGGRADRGNLQKTQNGIGETAHSLEVGREICLRTAVCSVSSGLNMLPGKEKNTVGGKRGKKRLSPIKGKEPEGSLENSGSCHR